MKFRARRAAAIVLAIALSLPVSAAGRVRNNSDRNVVDISEKIVRIVRQLQKFFGVQTFTDTPLPPRP